ncbi:hypothetical protein G4B84_005649 [Aspergillus flavus NRRL3357]|nr:uncharacterized protein G4B84_005649 [Aspergillus flavus NRRL3357]QMW30314.1 hypothetical protein G4B84_005649 [Aspergillus flavus NRRL3357]QMW42386.1 hypothetical protein G4B11_005710 [Aspergillus flavus]
MSRTLLITGATGKQGGSVINNLLIQDADFEILAVTRDAQSNGTQKLLKKSSKIKLVEGNLDHPEDIFRQAQKVTRQPIWGVFSVQGTDMQWVILRPVAFLNNFTPDFFGSVFTTSWKIVLRGKPLQLISVTDIGFFGAQAFLHPDEYKYRALSLTGDELSYDEMARIFKRVTGKDVPLTYGFLARLLMWAFKELGVMFRWFHDSGYKADVRALRKLHPGLKNFES